jgi:hypothetical protein
MANWKGYGGNQSSPASKYCHALNDYTRRRGLDWQLDLLESNTDTLNYNCVPPDSLSLWVTTLVAFLATTKLLSLGLLALSLALTGHQLTLQPRTPRYMTSGRTVEKILPLALLIVYPSPGNVYSRAYGLHVTKQRLLHGVHVIILSPHFPGETEKIQSADRDSNLRPQ